MEQSLKKRKCLLAIETSCDDTAIAIIKDNQLTANIVISSADEQTKYGGIVPELAARKHEDNIIKVFKLAQTKAKIDVNDIDMVAYTSCPGLRVSLNVGEIFAYTLCFLLKKEPIKINHIFAHIFSFWDLKSEIIFPFISLVASGGTTSIFLVKSVKDIILLNETNDDAIGECYDKIARELGLGYPGGPKIDKLYDSTKANINFLINRNLQSDNNFSFSGLKTAVLNYINNLRKKKQHIDEVIIASSFQKVAINILLEKLAFYIEQYQCQAISIGGGVAANSLLREKLKQYFKKTYIYLPDISLCGDNAAMIAIYAYLLTTK